MVLPQKPGERAEACEPPPTDQRVEVVKVGSSSAPLQVPHPQTGENIKMITDEVSQIQEVSGTTSERSKAAKEEAPFRVLVLVRR